MKTTTYYFFALVISIAIAGVFAYVASEAHEALTDCKDNTEQLNQTIKDYEHTKDSMNWEIVNLKALINQPEVKPDIVRQVDTVFVSCSGGVHWTDQVKDVRFIDQVKYIIKLEKCNKW